MRKTIGALLASVMLVALMAAPALADKPTTTSESVTFTDMNPCSGLEHEITIDYTITTHQHRNNLVIQYDSTTSTDDGFVGFGHETFVDNGKVVTSTINFVADNPETGAKFTVKGHFTFDVESSELRVDRFVFNCVKSGS